jgi:RimJ/RimL family protein N-acetyltransferase
MWLTYDFFPGIPKRPIVFSPVERDLDRTFLDLRWKLPENALKKDDLWYTIVVKEKDDLAGIGNYHDIITIHN